MRKRSYTGDRKALRCPKKLQYTKKHKPITTEEIEKLKAIQQEFFAKTK